ncbi:hypothetical protein JCM10450v2_006382 [Rhodotorula kratochvilovae]
MDAYLTSTKPGAYATARAASVKPGEGNARPFASLADAPKPSSASTSRNRIQGGVRDANNAIIKTLGKEDNPITNSTAYQRSLHVGSCATGHQSGGGAGPKWTLHRNTKLRLQAADAESQTLKGVVAYMSGYTGGDITNTQLKALVEMQGGRIVTVGTARCTHVFITSNLSGSKAQKFLEANRKNGAKLVTPQWAIECARRGRRVSEAQFAAPVYNETGASPSAPVPTAVAAGTLLPPAPISPRGGASPRKRAGPMPPSKDSSSSATALLLAQLAAQAQLRSPGKRSPGREARTGTKRRSTHVASWECSGDGRGM